MFGGKSTRALLIATAATVLLALPALAQAKGPEANASATGLTLGVKGSSHVQLLRKVTVSGQLLGANPGEQVDVTVSASDRELSKKTITPKGDGSFEVPIVVNACCHYVIDAKSTGGQTGSAAFNVDVPKKLGSGAVTDLFNRSLRAQGFHTGPAGSKVTLGTHLAIKAFRKVNHMSWSEAYNPAIFRTLLMGQGAFEPRFNDGHHVEVDISRQVMALVEGDTAVQTFHVSTGTGGTPTVQGNFNFYMKQPGYNAKQMYYSVYFIAGYATHGYADVPNHNASHGCVRNPIPFSRFIYNWIQIGDPMHVYS